MKYEIVLSNANFVGSFKDDSFFSLIFVQTVLKARRALYENVVINLSWLLFIGGFRLCICTDTARYPPVTFLLQYGSLCLGVAHQILLQHVLLMPCIN